MAVENLCSSRSRSRTHHQLLVVLFFCLAVSSVHLFNPDDLRPEDDAQVTGGRIELLGDEFADRARGRAWHKDPVQLWDGATGKAASFTANFTFMIQSVPPGKGAPSVGHGMAFFLAPYTPVLPQESYDGCLGLFDESQAANYATVNASGDARFVAVEFDTHKDVWDPSDRHIGVDVNSMNSHGDYTVLPDGSLVDAGVLSANVAYDNGTRSLTVTLIVGTDNNYTAAATVDLPSVLPEQVAVGFSAATGHTYAGNHTVLSFSFLSTLPTKNGTSLPATSSSNKTTTIELGVGVAAAAVLVLLLVAAIAVLLVRRRGKRPYDEEKLTTDGDDSLDDGDFEGSTGPRPIPYAELAAATKDFAAEGKLGQGGSGSVYRGHHKETGRDVAIKVFSRGASIEGKREYRSEVTVISRLRHRNLVQLIGWCHGRRRLLLVYELVSNGSLDGHLYSTEVMLTWPTSSSRADPSRIVAAWRPERIDARDERRSLGFDARLDQSAPRREAQQMSLICNARTHVRTFKQRKSGLEKKAFELAELCSVDVAVVCAGPGGGTQDDRRAGVALDKRTKPKNPNCLNVELGKQELMLVKERQEGPKVLASPGLVLNNVNLEELLGKLTRAESRRVKRAAYSRTIGEPILRQRRFARVATRQRSGTGPHGRSFAAHWDQCVVHGDIKPSNIMLDESFNAKLGDFGLARLIDHGMSLQTMTAVAGTPGYLDPECVITGKASTESDMYSFGVVLLERRQGDGQVFRLVEWAWDMYGRGAALDTADERLRVAFDPWEMERVVAVGLWCAHPDPKMRAGIRQGGRRGGRRRARRGRGGRRGDGGELVGDEADDAATLAGDEVDDGELAGSRGGRRGSDGELAGDELTGVEVEDAATTARTSGCSTA
ncbi:hypothetical protein HU200_063104 [Digitaria exilis]|uniref:non-specific serine/threonine protein kinase n=1 Tax=Digitaria exilis TaxID=1010633 RepID=A0A835DXN4_9POAL|nr:hypothetical protein HU200_063104 [Digitaria exilis]